MSAMPKTMKAAILTELNKPLTIADIELLEYLVSGIAQCL